MGTDITVSGDAFTLASFETPVTNEALPAVLWSVQKHEVAHMIAVQGVKPSEIAKQTGVPLSTINRWLKHPEFVAYVNQVTLESVNTLKAKRISMLSKMLDARVKEAEDDGGRGYAGLSQKDTLEIIKELRNETEDTEKAQESTYTKLLERMLANSVPAQVIDITNQSQQ